MEITQESINYMAYCRDLCTYIVTDLFRIDNIKINVRIVQGDTLVFTFVAIGILELLSPTIAHRASVDPKNSKLNIIKCLAFADDLAPLPRFLGPSIIHNTRRNAAHLMFNKLG